MRFKVSKMRLLAALTTMALAFMNFSGLALDAKATLLDLPEYTATAVLNGYNNAEIKDVKISDLLSSLTGVKKLDPMTGEYHDAELKLPADYKVIVADSGKAYLGNIIHSYPVLDSSEGLYLNSYGNTYYRYVWYDENRNAVKQAERLESPYELDLLVGSGNQLDADNIRLKIKLSRCAENLKTYDAVLDLTDLTEREIKEFTADDLLKKMEVYDPETNQKLSYSFPDDVNVWKVLYAPSGEEVDSDDILGSSEKGYFEAIYPSVSRTDKLFESRIDWRRIENTSFIIGNGGAGYYDLENSAESGNTFFRVKMKSYPRIKDTYYDEWTASSQQKTMKLFKKGDSGDNYTVYENALGNYTYTYIGDFDPNAEYYIRAQIQESMKKSWKENNVAVNVYEYSDFFDLDDPASFTRTEVGAGHTPITDKVFSKDGFKADIEEPKDAKDVYGNSYVIVYTRTETGAGGVQVDTGKILDKEFYFFEAYEKNINQVSGLRMKNGDNEVLISASTGMISTNHRRLLEAPETDLREFDHVYDKAYISRAMDNFYTNIEIPSGFDDSSEFTVSLDGFKSKYSDELIVPKKIEALYAMVDGHPCYERGVMKDVAGSVVERHRADVTEQLKTGLKIGQKVGLEGLFEYSGRDYDPSGSGDVFTVDGYSLIRYFIITLDSGREIIWSLYVNNDQYDVAPGYDADEIIDGFDPDEYPGAGKYNDYDIEEYPKSYYKKDSFFFLDSLADQLGIKLNTRLISNDPDYGKFYDLDSSYEYGWQTAIISGNVSDTMMKNLIPTFEVYHTTEDEFDDDGNYKQTPAGVFVNGHEIFSGRSKVDFSEGTVKFRVASRSKSGQVENHALTYNVTAAKTVKGGAKLFVNGPKTRDVYFGYYKYYHNILLLNLGDQPLTGLKVELKDAEGVKLDGYWTVGGEKNDVLQPFVDEDGEFTSNMAMVKLVDTSYDPADDDFDEGKYPYDPHNVSGTLVFSADGQEDIEIDLRGQAGDPTSTAQVLDDAVKYVPYSTIISTDNYSREINEHFSAEGLPAGLRLDPGSGELYGTPQEAGEFEFKVKVEFYQYSYSPKNVTGSVELPMKLTVLPNTFENVFGETDEDEGYGIKQPIGSDLYTEENDYIMEYKLSPDELQAKRERMRAGEPFLEGFDVKDELFISLGKFSNFDSFWFNGHKLVRDVDYYAEEGSTEITITEQTLINYVEEGDNTIAAEFREEDDEMKVSAQNIRYELSSLDFKTDIVVKLVDANGDPVANMPAELHSDPKKGTSGANGCIAFNGVENGKHYLLANGVSCNFSIEMGAAVALSENVITSYDGAKVLMKARVSDSGITILSVKADDGDQSYIPEQPGGGSGSGTGAGTDTGSSTDTDTGTGTGGSSGTAGNDGAGSGTENNNTAAGGSTSASGGSGGDGAGAGSSGGASSDGGAASGTEKSGTGDSGASPAPPSDGGGNGTPDGGSSGGTQDNASGGTPQDGGDDTAPLSDTGSKVNYSLMAVSLILLLTAFRRKNGK